MGLGPFARGMMYITGMDFEKVAIPAQIPRYAPGRAVRARMTKRTGMASNIPQMPDRRMLNGEKSQTFRTSNDFSEPLLAT